MNNDFIVEDIEFENTVSRLNRVSLDSLDEVEEIPKKFSSLRNTGLFGNGIDKINRQLNAVTQATINVKNKVNKHKNEIFMLENSMASKARELDVPLDFVKKDSRKYNSIDDIYLEKKDGRSVNDGNASVDVSELDDYTGTLQNLANISSNLELREEKLDEKTVITEQQKLGNINNDKQIDEQEINEINDLDKNNLKNINNGNNLNNTDLDNMNLENINSTNLENINNYNNIDDDIGLLEIEGE